MEQDRGDRNQVEATAYPVQVSDNTWTWAGAHVPGLEGQTVYFVGAGDAEKASDALAADGWTVHRLDGTTLQGARQAREAVVTLLGLEETGARTMDGLADVLRDLRAPEGSPARVALIWENAQALLEADLPAWTEIVQILTNASAELWDPEDDANPQNVVFETILAVEGYGVRPLGGVA